MVVASNRDTDGAERQVGRLKNRYAAVLGAERSPTPAAAAPACPARCTFAQVGRDSRAEAEALCGRLRAAGADCMVLRN